MRSNTSPFPPFCGTPHPSRSTGPRFDLRRSKTRPFPPFYGTLGLVSIGCSVQASWLPMNTTTQFLRSDPAMYTSPGRTYARVGIRDPARMYIHGRIYFLAPWLYVRVHATCAPLLRHMPFLTQPRFIAAACKQTD